ncbi:MAG: hypothetical protein AAGI69_27465 [Cyanobacteria bacterium P01_H01_bin.21]
MKLGFPKFYRAQVYPYIQPAVAYLQATPLGQQIVENLEANVEAVKDNEPALSRNKLYLTRWTRPIKPATQSKVATQPNATCNQK